MNNSKRRDFIKINALGFVGVALHLSSISTYAQKANAHFGSWDAQTNLNWDAFFERLSSLATKQHEMPWNQKQHARQVKRLLLQCNFPEFKNIKTEMESYENRHQLKSSR